MDKTLADIFFNIIRRLSRVQRWNKEEFENRSYIESSLNHSFESTLLVICAVALEKKFGRKDFDAFKVLACGALHDIGEGILFDVPLEVKDDARVKKALEEMEEEATQELIKRFHPAIKEGIEDAYNLQKDRESFEGKLWYALELLGYIMYAWREYHLGHENFSKVFKNSFPKLLTLSKEIKSVEILLNEFRPVIERILKEESNSQKVLPFSLFEVKGAKGGAG
ncbi:MAG: HD domain-containing protein [Patescibacteria group bacterium]|nr:HD domain-containing protein [Patescibacteria group bacterium]MDD5490302.1 HD domain-containing protein [Patescibacteria group bacterium]